MRQRETKKPARAMDWLLVIKVSRQCSNRVDGCLGQRASGGSEGRGCES